MKALSKTVGVLLVAVLVVLMNPTLRYDATGLIHREKFVDYHPVSYWIGQCRSQNAYDRYSAVNALGRAGVKNQQVANALTERCSDYDVMVKIAAIGAVNQLGLKSVAIHGLLQEAEGNVNFLVRNAAQTALKNLYNQNPPRPYLSPLALQPLR